MNENNFWEIIESSKTDNQDEQLELFRSELERLNKADLIGFEVIYREKLHAAYNWGLWGAAYIINGGCSDDSFDYFCDWLISQGRETFDAALEDPETLIGKVTIWNTEFEDFRYIMMDVMEAVHKSEFPAPTKSRPQNPSGQEWDEEEVETLFPKLSKWVNEESQKNIDKNASTPLPDTPSKKSWWKRLFKL
jgi:hypothetical protein